MRIETNFTPIFKQDLYTFDPAPGENNINSEETKEQLENDNNSINIECACGHAIIKLWKNKEEYSFAVYTNTKSTIKERLKKTWRLLVKGEEVLLEDLVLYQEDVNKIVDFVR